MGNIFADVSTPYTGTAPNVGTILVNNIGIDNVFPSIASASSINVGLSSQFNLTGGITVTTISPGWTGREIRIVNGGASTLAGGGNIVSVPASFSVNQLIICNWTGTGWACQ
jgi:hypothetical protein